MPSIYEALMRAAEEREALKRRRPDISPDEAGESKSTFDLQEEMLALLETLESLLPRSPTTVIQFTPTEEEGGIASSMAREYAGFSASVTGRSVLLLTGDTAGIGVESSKSSVPEGPLEELASWIPGTGPLFQRVKDLNLFVSKTAGTGLLDASCGDSSSKELLWNLLKERFDVIVIDGSAAGPCTGRPLSARHLDGVLLVFESDLALTEGGSGRDAPGLSSVLDVVARGALLPRRVITCLGAPVLILTPPGR